MARDLLGSLLSPRPGLGLLVLSGSWASAHRPPAGGAARLATKPYRGPRKEVDCSAITTHRSSFWTQTVV